MSIPSHSHTHTSTPLYPHIFTLTFIPPHLHTPIPLYPHILTLVPSYSHISIPSHAHTHTFHTLTPSHAHTHTSIPSHLHMFTLIHVYTSTPLYSHTFTFSYSYLHTFIPSHLHILILIPPHLQFISPHTFMYMYILMLSSHSLYYATFIPSRPYNFIPIPVLSHLRTVIPEILYTLSSSYLSTFIHFHSLMPYLIPSHLPIPIIITSYNTPHIFIPPFLSVLQSIMQYLKNENFIENNLQPMWLQGSL